MILQESDNSYDVMLCNIILSDILVYNLTNVIALDELVQDAIGRYSVSYQLRLSNLADDALRMLICLLLRFPPPPLFALDRSSTPSRLR